MIETMRSSKAFSDRASPLSKSRWQRESSCGIQPFTFAKEVFLLSGQVHQNIRFGPSKARPPSDSRKNRLGYGLV